jgi:hypothetical protein
MQIEHFDGLEPVLAKTSSQLPFAPTTESTSYAGNRGLAGRLRLGARLQLGGDRYAEPCPAPFAHSPSPHGCKGIGSHLKCDAFGHPARAFRAPLLLLPVVAKSVRRLARRRQVVTRE